METSRHSIKTPTDKKVRIDIAFLRQSVEMGLVKDIIWTPTHKQLADVLTKRGVNNTPILEVLSTGQLRC